MFPRLKREGEIIKSQAKINAIFEDPAFTELNSINILPIIYDEHQKKCNILVFDYDLAKQNTAMIKMITKENENRGRKHPAYRFYDKDGDYICEVRYGGASANALQRGFWTHTKNGLKYFNSVTNGWVNYSHNPILVQLFSHALVASESGHKIALQDIRNDIDVLKKKVGLK